MYLLLSLSEVDFLENHAVPPVLCLFLGPLTPCKVQNCSCGITVVVTKHSYYIHSSSSQQERVVFPATAGAECVRTWKRGKV